ncbi:uroporphyrinogen-III C-methyltransferase [Marinobacterium sedimentorum]|uniref:uroporphyrinogen-III C-methyltransferase n=1 Tax=Marinobacterium sedimentorum TaxID=2927804 RepID=UPI0020C67021|nr:uroporphyrinogen-III C-methyltransferase [Marinobacterium sedimentorum]MCP8688954.1 uroporphyrinogen-III C-methyltransferase [Marinobacterium sedimentorum]
MSDTGNRNKENRTPEIIDAEVTEVPTQNPPKSADSPEKVKSASRWPALAALVLSIIALVLIGYLGWQGWQWQQGNAQALQQISEQADSAQTDAQAQLTQELDSLQQQMATLKSQAQTDKSGIDALQERLTQSIQQVMSRQQSSRKDWLLAEAEYLLRLANQRVLMEQTADGALKLLKSADLILKETDDVSIYEVRKALAADIAALESVPRLDTEGAFLQLGALNTQVDRLSLVPVTNKRELPALLEQITPDSVSESWTQGLKSSWDGAMNKFEQLIVIQHRDEAVEPLLSPEQHFFLQQNLHLMLEQAQLALLQRKQNAYDSALGKAENWIDTYFDPQDATTNALLRGIAELKLLQVSPEVPDISGSLNTLKAYLQQMTKLKQEGAA